MWLRRSWYSFRPLKPTAWVEGDRRWRVSTGRIDTRAIAESVVTPAVSEADRKALYRLNNNLPSHASVIAGAFSSLHRFAFGSRGVPYDI